MHTISDGSSVTPLSVRADRLWSRPLVARLGYASDLLDRLSTERGRLVSRHLLWAEATVGLRDGSPAGDAAVERFRQVLRSAGSTTHLNVDLIRGWHARLISDAAHLRPGRYRDTESVGIDADLRGWSGMPPAPAEAIHLLDDLTEFANRSVDHPMVKAAMLSAQFLAIRPFLSGNGRVARVLMYWSVGRGWPVIPPFSLVWSANPARLEFDLDSWRRGDDEERWVAQTVQDLVEISERCEDLADALEGLRAGWLAANGGRTGSLRRNILTGLVADPVIDGAIARTRFGADPTRFSRVARQLVEEGILTPVAAPTHQVGRPRRRYEAPHVREVVERWVDQVTSASRGRVVAEVPALPVAASRLEPPRERARSSRGRPVPSKVRRPS